MNMFAPMIDHFTEPTIYGGEKKPEDDE